MNTRYPNKTVVPVAIPTPDGKAVARTVKVTVPCRIDSKTGEVTLGGEALRMIDEVKAHHMGLLPPDEIRRLREVLGLTQAQMSGLLQIGAKSYTRWETGRERPLRAMNILLRGLWDGKLDVNYLRAIQTTRFSWRRLAPLVGVPSGWLPYTVDVTESKEACGETKRVAA